MAHKARRRPSWKRNPVIKVPVKLLLSPEAVEEIGKGKDNPTT